MALDGEDFRLFKGGIHGSCLCSTMNDDEILELAQRCDLLDIPAGRKVLLQGEPGQHFYVVLSGEFHQTMDGDFVGSLGAGDTFGEVALIHDCRQWTSIAATAPSRVWAARHDAFGRAVWQLARRNFKENMRLLEQVQIFEHVDTKQRTQLCQEVSVQIYAPGAAVVEEGGSGDTVFVVKSGALEVRIGDRWIRNVGVGDYFGERSLLFDEPRSATVVASVRTACLPFRRQLLQRCLGDMYSHALYNNMMAIALKSSLAFSEFHFESIRTLVQGAVVRDLQPGEALREAASGSYRFFVVLSGEVRVRAAAAGAEGVADGSPAEEEVLGRGRYFGDEYVGDLTKPFRHMVENVASSSCKLTLFSSEVIRSMVSSGDVQEKLNRRQLLAELRKVYIFRHLSNQHCRLLVRSFKTITKMQNEHAVTEGEHGSQFFVIKTGEFAVDKTGLGRVRTLGKGDYFGERGLLYNEPRSATVSCTSSQGELLVIDKHVFTQIIEGGMLKHLDDRIRLQNTFVTLADLTTIRTVGHGTFGIVRLVEHQTTKTQYALKCISRQQAVQNSQEVALKLEREILLENDHPFIVKVVKTFRDPRYLYFLTELATGGELYDAIRQIGLLKKDQAQFYTGSLVLALESLHERSICYRDLKPENVLLDNQGFVKLIDFGCAIRLRGIAYTLTGTPHYMAPEVILGQGYGTSCDVWSLGVCLFEFACGPLPFANDSDDNMDIFRRILQEPMKFPGHADPAAVHALRRILRRPVEKRLGCGPKGWNAVKKHVFFQGFSWDRLMSRQLETPLMPRPREDGGQGADASHPLPPEMPVLQHGWDAEFGA